MDGFRKESNALVHWVLIATTASLLLAADAIAQTECDGGNPCQQNDTASQSGIGPSAGANNPIDVITGNKYQAEIDFRLPGELAVSFTRHYNSISVQGGAFGGGWSHTYETALTRMERAGKATITIVQGDGRRIEFRAAGAIRNGVQRYVSRPYGYGVIDEHVVTIERLRRESLRATGNLRPWEWTWADGRKLAFDDRGALRQIQAASGEWLRLEYDRHGRLSRVTDFAERKLELAYWDRPSEWLPTFEEARIQGAKHRLKSLHLPDGRVIEYGYDANGLLSEARFPDGTRKRYEYHETGGALRLGRIFARGGHVAGAYAYDSNGDAVQSAVGTGAQAIHIDRAEPALPGELGTSILTDHGGAKTSYRWRHSAFGPELVDAAGPGCATCPASNVRYQYGEQGLVERIDRLSPISSVVESSEIIARDSLGRIVERYREKDGDRELIERVEYESDDAITKPSRITRRSIAPGRSKTFELHYNGRGQITSLIESGYAPVDGGLSYASLDRSTSYRYYEAEDGSAHLIGRLKSIDGPLPGEGDVIQYRYDARGLLSRIVYPGGAAERFEHDTLGRLSRYVPLDGVPILLEYDSEGRVSSYTRAGLRARVIYDADGRIEKLHDPIGQQLIFRYEGTTLRAVEDVCGNRIELELDAEGRLRAKRLLNPDGTIAQVSSTAASPLKVEREPFSPTALSFLRLPILKSWTDSSQPLIQTISADTTPASHREVTDERGLVSHYRFDDFGRLVHVFNPDAGSLTLEYDEANRVVARHYADGRAIRYAYDAQGRIATIAAGNERVAIDYGAYGKPARIRYGWGEECFEYDSAARLIRRTQRIDGHEFIRAYRYDALGRRSADTLLDGTTLSYRYNGPVHAKPGVLSSIERKGLFSSRSIVSGLNEASDGYARSTLRFGNGLEFERELDVRGHLRRFGTPGLAHFELESDAAGKIASVDDGRRRLFSYDTAGRLERASFVDDDDAVALGFDAADNVRFHTSQGMQTLLRVDQASNRLLEKTDANGTRVQYTYDAAGRTTRIGDRELEYDAFGRTARVLENGRTLAEYSYNAFGERIRKVVYSGSGQSVTYFFYNGSKLTAEADDRGRITKQFVYVHDRVVALLIGASTYAVHTDWLGTPMAVTDEDRRIVWRAQIDPLGRTRAERGHFRLDLRGSNHYLDRETGLHYNIHRYFDPSTSRYLTPDPTGQFGGMNVYAFANGDPINFVDPLGLQAIPPDYDDVDRLRVLLQGAIDAFPESLRDSVVAAIEELLAPESLAIAAAIFVAWGVSHLTPFGWAADLLVVGLGVAFMGAAIVDLARGTVAAYRAMRDAETIQQLCAAGRGFARTITDAVVELAGAGGAVTAVRRIGVDVASQIRRMFGRNSRPPPPDPLPWTQEMLTRVRDGFGNRIRQFMAGRNHMWRTEAERGRWRVFEDAAESFVRAYFKPRYVINARHNNGSPNPDGANGFDVVFVNQQGRLVIGEAKSGTVTPITAFGGGARGEAQLELNLEVLRTSIRLDPSIPEATKLELLRQIDSRTFETQLYVSPTSTIPQGRLDVYQQMLDRPLDAIYILPEELRSRT